EEALAVSDRITVLRDGRVAATGPTREFDRDRLIRLMVGRTISGALHAGKGRLSRPYGKKILSVANMSATTMVNDCSFTLYG
ncbi:sugar ABC transporter ATP-binding protein, partial [Rhizobiaceae sp. 2RAB30]